MLGESHHQFGSLTISAYAEHETDGTYGVAYCPLCEHRDESHDHSFGSHYAVMLSVSKIKTHLRLTHHLSEPEEFPPTDDLQSAG